MQAAKSKWVPTAVGAAAGGLILLPVTFALSEYTRHDERHLDRVAALGDEWSRSVAECAVRAERTLMRGPMKRNGRAKRRGGFELRITGSTIEEKDVFCVVGFFQRVGFAIDEDDDLVNDLHRLHADSWQRWLPHLERLMTPPVQLTLDEARREQVANAYWALKAVCGTDAITRVSRQQWRALTLSDVTLTPRTATQSVHVSSVLQNPNGIPTPVPALRAVMRSNDGLDTGSWLIIPSDPFVPAFGEVEVGTQLSIEGRGTLTGLRLEGNPDWIRRAFESEVRFPAHARQTHRLPSGDTW